MLPEEIGKVSGRHAMRGFFSASQRFQQLSPVTAAAIILAVCVESANWPDYRMNRMLWSRLLFLW